MSSSKDRTVTTEVGMLSYPHLFTPQDAFDEGGDPQFSGVLVFTEGTDLTAAKAAVAAAGVEKFGEEKFAQLLKAGNVRSPFRLDGDEKGYPEGSVYIQAKSNAKKNPKGPGLVARYADPETGGPRAITDPDELYPGCQVRFNVTAFGYDVRGNRGVAFALNHVQKWADGERLDGRTKPESVFDIEAPVTAELPEGEAEKAPASVDAGDDGDLAGYL